MNKRKKNSDEMKNKISICIRPKHWWSIKAWKRAKTLQSLDNWSIQQLLQRYNLLELLNLDWKGIEKVVEEHLLKKE